MFNEQKQLDLQALAKKFVELLADDNSLTDEAAAFAESTLLPDDEATYVADIVIKLLGKDDDGADKAEEATDPSPEAPESAAVVEEAEPTCEVEEVVQAD